jgi:hypothetical protein
MRNNLRRSRSRLSGCSTPINVTVNVQVNGFRLTDIALQAEIERHRKSSEDANSQSLEENVVVVRELRDLSENESETSQKATDV